MTDPTVPPAPTAPAAAGPVVMQLTPEARERMTRYNTAMLRWLSFSWIPLIAVICLIAVLALQSLLPLLFIAIAVMLGLGGGLATGPYVRRAVDRVRIELDDGAYVIGDGRRFHRFTAGDVDQVVHVARHRLSRAQEAPLLIVVGARRRLAILTGQMWTPQQLGALADDLVARGARRIDVEQPVSARQLRAMDRRWITWMHAHPALFVLLAVLAAVLVVIIAIVILAVASGA